MDDSIDEGRKEDGNIAIAEKIINRLHDLDKTVINNQGRWAWELLQNAKDSVAEYPGRNISIQLAFTKDYVEFRHDGAYFTEKDIRGLINQISSKEVAEGEKPKKNGRFGTGFLTTHLLSKTVDIEGIVKAKNGKYYSFTFTLDRDAKKNHLLIPKIEAAWNGYKESKNEINTQIDELKFNTVFRYQLKTKEQIEIAKIGINEFITSIPFVLAFNPKIESVIIENESSNKQVRFKNSDKLIDDFIVPITKTEDSVSEVIFIAKLSNEDLSVSALLTKTEESYKVEPLNEYPKLFCDFPLIGTERFNFPVIVNSFYFNPQRERDGLWLLGNEDDSDKDVLENQSILENAVELYKQLLHKFTDGEFKDLFNVANTAMPVVDEKYFDSQWYKSDIQKPLREIIYNAPIVETEDGTKVAVSLIWFPAKSLSQKVQETLWKFQYDLYPESVTKKEQINQWSEIYWEACYILSYRTLTETIDNLEDMTGLGNQLNANYSNSICWINDVCNFIYDDDNNLSLFSTFRILPNKNGNFAKIKDLYLDKIGDDVLIEITELIGDDWKDILVADHIYNIEFTVREKKHIATKITEKLRNHKNDPGINKAILILSEWFDKNNPDESKVLFHELYKTRYDLFMNTIKETDRKSLYKFYKSGANFADVSKIAETIAQNPELLNDIAGATGLANLYTELGISSIEELKQILRNEKNHKVVEKLEITPELLASLGISSKDELEEALKDRDFAARFNHKSKTNVEMFVYAQRLIARAKINVLNHLKTLDDYNCDEADLLSTSVIGGIKKKDLDINIVVRPSDFGEVILYYNSEKDTLDYVNSELWIENGKDQPRHLTLGKIIKNIGINKIPV